MKLGEPDAMSGFAAPPREVDVLEDEVSESCNAPQAPSLSPAPNPMLLASIPDLDLPEALAEQHSLKKDQLQSLCLHGTGSADKISEAKPAVNPRMPSDASTCADFEDLQEAYSSQSILF